MPKAFVDLDRCLTCKKCFAAEVCPVKAIFRVDPHGPAVVEQTACFACGDCVEKCSGNAITIRFA